MRRALAALAAAAGAACQSTPRLAGDLLWSQDLADLAKKNDPRGLAVVTPAGAPLPFLSDPFVAGARVLQASDRDGLVVQPAFCDTHQAAFVTTERWQEFPKVWAQPLYIPVTGFDPANGPTPLPGSFPVFGVGPASRFYGPFWQVYYVSVPASTSPAALRSGEQIERGNYTLTQGNLRLASIVPKGLGIAAPGGQEPQHPFTGDQVLDRLPSQAWVDNQLVFFLDWGDNRFRINDANNVVNEVALFHFAIRAADGTAVSISGLPPVVGTGAFRGAKAADAPNGIPQFGSLQHAYQAILGPTSYGTTMGIFVSASRPALRAYLISQVGSTLLPLPGSNAEALPEREQFTGRVALDQTCFDDTDFPERCVWLDSQSAVEGNLPSEAFVDEKVFTAGPLVFFDGVAP